MESGKKVVLVVEDHPINMRLAAELLEQGGFEAVQAGDGETALEWLKTRRPDLILLDLGLPGLSGGEVLREIRRDPRLSGVPVSAFTAMVMRETREEIQGMGFDHYISKPVDTAEFLRVVREATAATR